MNLRRRLNELYRSRVKVTGITIFAMGLAVAAVETAIHYFESGVNIRLLFELMIYVLVLPVIGLLFVRYVSRNENARIQAEDALNHYLALLKKLSETDDWDTLVHQVAEVPQSILPVDRSSLYIYNPEAGGYELAAEWEKNPDRLTAHRLSGELLDAGLAEDDLTYCNACPIAQATKLHPIPHLSNHGNYSSVTSLKRYCLPLSVAERPVGLLQFNLPGGEAPTEGQVFMLNSIAPQIGLTLERTWLHTRVKSHAEAAESERRYIAQELHDSLGQNIAYLRLKLDQLTYQNDPLKHIADIQIELERMRDIADEAYHQVRETLADLHPDNTKELSRVLIDHAQMISDRSSFRLKVNLEGTPTSLRPHIQRQVLYIFREALGNVEKHSHANSVEIHIGWQSSMLLIEMKDDGIGFDANYIDGQSHFGLGIMRERAEAIQAEFKVVSYPGQGSLIRLCVPLVEPGDPRKIREMRQDLTIPIFRPTSK